MAPLHPNIYFEMPLTGNANINTHAAHSTSFPPLFPSSRTPFPQPVGVGTAWGASPAPAPESAEELMPPTKRIRITPPEPSPVPPAVAAEFNQSNSGMDAPTFITPHTRALIPNQPRRRTREEMEDEDAIPLGDVRLSQGPITMSGNQLPFHFGDVQPHKRLRWDASSVSHPLVLHPTASYPEPIDVIDDSTTIPTKSMDDEDLSEEDAIRSELWARVPWTLLYEGSTMPIPGLPPPPLSLPSPAIDWALQRLRRRGVDEASSSSSDDEANNEMTAPPFVDDLQDIDIDVAPQGAGGEEDGEMDVSF